MHGHLHGHKGGHVQQMSSEFKPYKGKYGKLSLMTDCNIFICYADASTNSTASCTNLTVSKRNQTWPSKVL